MYQNNTHNKRNLSLSLSSPTTDEKKSKIFVTPNRFAALDDGTTSEPEVFSPPPVTDELLVQGDNSKKTSIQSTSDGSSHSAPTIYIKNVTNFSKLKYDIISILGPDAVTFKSSMAFITIRSANYNIFANAASILNKSRVSFHTHTPQHLRPIQAVIRHLHYSTPTEDIKTVLDELGFSVLNVSNIQNKKTKAPLPLFLINLEPKEHNLEIFQVTKLLNSIVIIEKPRKSRQPPQCKKCQMYGHTRNWCNHQPRCVKCSENHPTDECTKSRATPAKCVLCSGAHTANYRGCPAFKQEKKYYLKRRLARKMNNTDNNDTPVPPAVPLAANIPTEPPPIKPKNYAEATKNHNTNGSSPPISTILSNFISNLNAIISPLISLLTTVLNSLLTKVA